MPEEIEEKPCAKDMFRCENGPCIHESLHCDGVIDCPFDISDELDCHNLYYNFCKWKFAVAFFSPLFPFLIVWICV